MVDKPLIQPPPDAADRIQRLAELTSACWQLKVSAWRALYPNSSEADLRARALKTLLENNAWHRPPP